VSNPTQISLSQYTWAQWKREASAARDRAGRVAWVVFGLVTIAVAWVGLAEVEGTWRYSVIIYAPIVGLIPFEPTSKLAMRRTFRATGAAMRYRLVPALVPHATDAHLAELVTRNHVLIHGDHLRAVDTGKEVIVSVNPPSSTSWTGGSANDVVVGDIDGGGYAGGGDAVGDGGGGFGDGGGGGFGGGGGDGGGGG
jgi:hypothetical protein